VWWDLYLSEVRCAETVLAAEAVPIVWWWYVLDLWLMIDLYVPLVGWNVYLSVGFCTETILAAKAVSYVWWWFVLVLLRDGVREKGK